MGEAGGSPHLQPLSDWRGRWERRVERCGITQRSTVVLDQMFCSLLNFSRVVIQLHRFKWAAALTPNLALRRESG